MPRITVASSQISTIEYDEKKQALYVKFNNGDWYMYFSVPKKVADKFMYTPEESHGKHFWKHIRSDYDYQKVSRK